jgi:urate oxidase
MKIKMCVKTSSAGLVHIVKELEVSTRLTLATQKDYLLGDNSDIIATDSQKNIVYLLAKKYGIKSPEDFGILLCNHFMSKYNHVTKVSIRINETRWNRVSYSDHQNVKLHNHAFIHTPICTRTASVVLKKGEQHPVIISGIENLRVLKTTKSSFVNFINDEYRTLPDADDRIFSTVVDCSWVYCANPQVDFDKTWKEVKYSILANFAGDLDQGIPSPSVQNTLYVTEKDIMDKINDINSIEMTLPNKHYISFDFSKFKNIIADDEQTVYLPLDKPSGVIYAKLDRKLSKM